MQLPFKFQSYRSKLHKAIRRDDATKITHILSRKTLTLSARHLKQAVSTSSHSALEALLSNSDLEVPQSRRKRDPQSPAHETLTPALHAAAASLDPIALSILVSFGADVRALHKGLEPLHLAVLSSSRNNTQPEVAKTAIMILVSAGALKGQFEEKLYPPNYAITHKNNNALSAMLAQPTASLCRALKKYSTIRYACANASLDAFQTLFPHIDQDVDSIRSGNSNSLR